MCSDEIRVEFLGRMREQFWQKRNEASNGKFVLIFKHAWALGVLLLETRRRTDIIIGVNNEDNVCLANLKKNLS